MPTKMLKIVIMLGVTPSVRSGGQRILASGYMSSPSEEKDHVCAYVDLIRRRPPSSPAVLLRRGEGEREALGDGCGMGGGVSLSPLHCGRAASALGSYLHAQHVGGTG